MRRKEFRTRGVLVALAVLLALALVPGQAQSASCTSVCSASDGNDSIEVHPTSSTPLGLDFWKDDSTFHINGGIQWFWFRINDATK